jgi:tetratricopeptide (TPR) repeat protein
MAEPSDHPATTPQDVLRCAAELGDAGAHLQALGLLDHALAQHPRHAALHTARGWALENLEPQCLGAARAAYETAIALDAGDLWAHLGLATVLGELGEAPRCAPMYRELIEHARLRARGEPELLELMGWCQYRLGRLDDAAATFRAALGVDDAWASVRFDLALVLLLGGEPHAADLHCGHALRTLAKRGVGATAGTVKVALDDLDSALAALPRAAAPRLAAAAAPIRRRLLDALAGTPSAAWATEACLSEHD